MARNLRHLLGIYLSQNSSDYREANTIDQDSYSQKLVIDGMKDETRIETLQHLQVVSNSTRMTYRLVKKIFNDSNHPQHSDLIKDLSKLTGSTEPQKD